MWELKTTDNKLVPVETCLGIQDICVGPGTMTSDTHGLLDWQLGSRWHSLGKLKWQWTYVWTSALILSKWAEELLFRVHCPHLSKGSSEYLALMEVHLHPNTCLDLEFHRGWEMKSSGVTWKMGICVPGYWGAFLSCICMHQDLTRKERIIWTHSKIFCSHRSKLINFLCI